ncbi:MULTISPECIES: chitinase [unclassified Streptomyces]|uniref:chitinase n=1 Tax=unclassified Streptomyces TaxID=2593676 RepID=UPI00093AEAFE|nr:chitinase [Streptomyces sp. CB02058]OKI94159.1 hydrolase [Streptomyces sp. CB02058]
MQRRTRVSSALAGLIALGLACSACSTGGVADQTNQAYGSAPPPPTGAAAKTAYTPYVSATTAADTDDAGSPDTYNLAFVTSDASACTPLWGGTVASGSDAVAARAEALTGTGADLRVSFGGAAGTEAALACDSAEELADAYGEVLDAVGATKADFDIEGDALTDTASVTRRNEALALLQKERDLDVTYTLPVMPDGLEDSGTAVLEDAVDQGVDISAVNIMAMNYSTSDTGDMGDYAETAAEAAHDQLVDVLGLGEDEAWQALHITVMIGVNDVAGETFTLDDAASLRTFATRQGVGALSLWASFRDQECGADEDTTTASDTCSGVDQEAGAFAEALSG